MLNNITVLIPLAGVVSQLVSGYREWLVGSGVPDHHIASYDAMMVNGSFLDLVENIINEVIKEDYLMTNITDEPEANRILREWGLPEEVVLELKMEAVNGIVALIYGYLPDIYLAQLQSWQYGISEGWNLVLHVPKDQLGIN